MYEAKEGKNLLSVEAMKDMRQVEELFLKDPEYKKFCYKPRGHCEGIEADPNSGKIIESNYGYSGMYPLLVKDQDINEMTDEDLKTELLALMESPLWPSNKGSFDIDLTKENLMIKHAMSSILIGGPQEGFKNLTAGDQADKLIEWLLPLVGNFTKKESEESCENKWKKEGCGSYSSLEVIVNAGSLITAQATQYYFQGAYMIVMAFLFVYCFFWFQMGSALLAGASISIIILSFPATSIITSGIFQISYFGFLQIIGIFLVIGIAADDIFVFMDAWKQSEHVAPEVMYKENDNLPNGALKRRMAYTIRRSVRSMSITSTTTAAAFFANVFSPIMPIKSFGVFSGFLIPMNFLLVVIVMPCTIIWYERNIKGKCKYCCIPRSAEERDQILNAEQEISKVEIFFDKTWSKCVEKIKFVIIVVSLVWAGISFFYALSFEAPDE